MKEQRPFRSVISYNSQFGHLFIPSLKARIRHNDGPYYLLTDSNGFRNGWRNGSALNGKFKIILLGDSFAAGDGVSNEHRFSDLLMSRLDLEIINLAVSGIGVDQQLLIYENFADKIDHDAVIFAPHLDDLKRNLMSFRWGMDRESGKLRKIFKPFFTIVDEKLNLNNHPVPQEKFIREDEMKKNAEYSKLKVLASKLKHQVADFIDFSLLQKSTDEALANPESQEWQLMTALFKRLCSKTKDKPLLVCPIPFQSFVFKNEKPKYLEGFKRMINEKAELVDVLPSLRKNAKNHLFLNGCGHFTHTGHEAVSQVLESFILNLDGVIARPKPLNPAVLKNGNYYLGISCLYHDAAAALIHNGELIAAAQEERFTRIKHDKTFPSNAIHYCLEEGGINSDDLDGIIYYDDEFLTLERALTNVLSEGERGAKLWDTIKDSLSHKLSLSHQIKEKLKYNGKIYKTFHHRSHAASAFYASPFHDAAIVIADGVGEWACTSIGVGERNLISIIKEQRYPNSIGLLYSAFTWYCGFKVNSGEYKLMGLAPYGKPIYKDLIYGNLLTCQDDGAIQLNLDYFSFQYGEAMVNNKFEELFGRPAREFESRITRFYMDVAASIQLVVEELLLKVINYTFEITKKNNLVLAGGVALNCVANGRILREGPFQKIWIQPAAGDAGGAVGAAWELYAHLHQPDFSHQPIKNTFLGPSFSDDEIQAFIESAGYTAHRLEPSLRGNVIAQVLSEGKIVGHFNGRMEFGPRSLGSRSILGDPRNEEMQSNLNLKIKFRESFRPFAPAVLEEECNDWFDLSGESPYMLLVAPVKEDKRVNDSGLDDMGEDMIRILKIKRSIIPSVTHVDFSARIQTVSPNENGFYDVIKEFFKMTQCPILVNTSFNVRGEPIVCTPSDAYKCFMRTNMDILVLGNFLLRKEEQPAFHEEENWKSIFTLD